MSADGSDGPNRGADPAVGLRDRVLAGWQSRRSSARPDPHARRRPIAQRLAGAVAALGCLAAAGALIARLVAWHEAALLGAAAFSPLALLSAPVALLLFLAARSRSGAAVALVLTIWALAVQAPAYVASSAPPGPDLVVMTANVRLGQADAGAVVAQVRSRHVDVLMLEELNSYELDDLRRAGLDRLLPYSVVDDRPGAAGTGLWSRSAMTGQVKRADFGFALVTARVTPVAAGGRSVQLVALHMYGPYPSATAWTRDIDHLPALLQSFPSGPVLVGGDFNATPDTAQFRALLEHGYADAAEQAGAGWTPTYPADRRWGPLIAIDHVLTRGAVARSLDSLSIPASDHRALVAAVRFNPA